MSVIVETLDQAPPLAGTDVSLRLAPGAEWEAQIGDMDGLHQFKSGIVGDVAEATGS